MTAGNELNSVCMRDGTGAVKNPSVVYLVHPSHAAVAQMLSMIMLVVLLWLSLMFTAAFVVCILAVTYRMMAQNNSTERRTEGHPEPSGGDSDRSDNADG